MLGMLVKRQIVLSILTLLLGACGGSSGGGGGGFNEPPPGTPVTVSGTLSYEFVPPNLNCAGLNFSAIEVRPIRGSWHGVMAIEIGRLVVRRFNPTPDRQPPPTARRPS